MKLEAKQKKMEEKAEIKAEKERRKNSFGRKVKNFILTIIFTIILLCVGFYFANKVLIGLKMLEIPEFIESFI